MAISVITQPDVLAPANKELWYQLSDTTSYTNTNYKYVYKVNYKTEPFTNAFKSGGVYKVPPNPSGVAVFSPHKRLKSYFIPTINPFIVSYNRVDNSLIRYNITYGAEYNPNISFVSTSNNGGKLQLNFTSANYFSLNDIITIDKNNKQVNAGYDGTASITQVISSTSYKTDKTYGISSTNESGSIINVLRYQATSSDRDCYNGTRQYTERTTNFDTLYNMELYTPTTPPKNFMSNYPGSKKVQLTDYETLGGILSSTSPSSPTINITFYNANGGVLSTTTIPLTGNTYRRVDFGVGPKNLLSMVGSYPNLSYVNTCSYYTYVLKKSYAQLSEIKTYVIDNTCSPYIKKRVCFMNRIGGYDYFNFTMDSKRSVSVKKEEYNRTLDWNYNIGDRGTTVFATDVDEVFSMNTNWITEKECAWLEELITSPDVYLIEGTNKIPIVITDTKYENKTAMRDRIFNLTVNYKMANKMNIQND